MAKDKNKKNKDSYKTLSITLVDGECHEYTGKMWDDYTVALAAKVPVVVVKKHGAWVGIFPLAGIKSVIMS